MSYILRRGLLQKPGHIRRMGHAAGKENEKWVIDDSPNPLFSLKSISLIVGITGLGYYLRELRKDDNNFITAYLRREMEKQVEKGWRDTVQILQEGHQQMMEHIERKKFVRYPTLPSYSDMFAYPTHNLGTPRNNLPGSVDD